MDYDEWLNELATMHLHCDPEELEAAYPQLRSLLFDARMSPAEAADALRTEM